jgi:LmbE family N-acetylglucosaminyl deacetylase
VLADVVRQVRPAVILAPAALGGHVDHRVIRALAPELARSCGAALAWYEDLPYAGWMAADDIAAHLASIPGKLQPLDIRLDDAMAMKLSSIMLYGTQAAPEWVASIRSRALLLDPAGAERLWATASAWRRLRSILRGQ